MENTCRPGWQGMQGRGWAGPAKCCASTCYDTPIQAAPAGAMLGLDHTAAAQRPLESRQLTLPKLDEAAILM